MQNIKLHFSLKWEYKVTYLHNKIYLNIYYYYIVQLVYNYFVNQLRNKSFS